MNDIIDAALSAGFTHAVTMTGLSIQCEPNLREYCNPEQCPNYGFNWVCPPGCGSLEECSEKVGRFDKGVLLQSVSELAGGAVDYRGLNREHNLRLRGLIERMEKSGAGGGDVMAFTTGGCIFCDACSWPDPCVKPDVRMNSLSAYGIDAGKLCESARLEYSFRPDRVYFIALILNK